VFATDVIDISNNFCLGTHQNMYSNATPSYAKKGVFQLEWVEKIEPGFELPPSIGQLGQLRIVPKVPQVIEKIGGRDRDRTGDLLVANEESKFIRRGAATTYVF
jgi:hypothetical protein